MVPRARRGAAAELSEEERQALPQLLELWHSGALSTLLEKVPKPEAAQPAQKPTKSTPQLSSKQRASSKQNNGGVWESVKPKSEKVTGKDKLVENGWSVPIKSGLSELSSSAPGVCLVSSAEARKAVKELKSEHALAILSPTNADKKGEEVHVLVEDPTGRWQVRPRFVIQLDQTPVSYMEGKPKKAYQPDTVKAVLSFGKNHTDSETWAFACKNPRELTKQWLRLRAKVEFLDVRPPTRPAGAEDLLQVVVFVSTVSFVPLLRAGGKDGVIVRPYFESDADKQVYRSVPLAVGTSLAAAVRQAEFLGEKAFGVVATAQGFGVRVKTESFEEVLRQVRPDDYQQFLGTKWEISGLPMAMGKESLTRFLGDWNVHPLHTFRQGFRRTWIVRAAAEPVEKVISHDYGLAVIKEAAPRPVARPMERMRVPRADAFPPLAQRFERGQMHAPKSWAGVVAVGAAAPAPTQREAQQNLRRDGAVDAAAASQARATTPTPAPAARPAAQAPPAIAPTPAALVHTADFSQAVAAAVAAALKPMQDKLEETIVPMQRQLEHLQAEFVAIRDEPEADENEDEDMPKALGDAAAKRPVEEAASGRATRAKRSGREPNS